ncbi:MULTISPECIES: ABC transporter permease subunit [unclassified Coleofasciculus]|uniref:ABC transporter permease subunit n=1 Tax=unclassified Coleofasciculus TaxID=2692782 RepID=UPI00187F79A3|nr:MULTISPECIES: ABC transporter permease subunit [unclassified Coleofasciculus]MBE9125856.1 ABC transporter permease subunit [Coleofasciculus sp. LEGE 07081]MBE9149175.1 ABC transporter permease subunit [Coleofasciculus sp. LEGE 07092]
MFLTLLDRIGNWNPQLLREIKGRLTFRNSAIAIASSLLSQLLYMLFWLGRLDSAKNSSYIGDIYCRLQKSYQSSQQHYDQLQVEYRQLQEQFRHYSSSNHYDLQKIHQLKDSIAQVKGQITTLQQQLFTHSNCPTDAFNMQLWWQDHLMSMVASFSVTVMFVLLGLGTYMLISDLDKEEQRGTLNFLRLSPQSALSILIGKLLGVPVLLYLGAILMVPLYLGLGFSAQIPGIELFSFLAALVAGSAFFFSGAIVFGLVSSWLGGFQAWLGSGIVLIFLGIANSKGIGNNVLDWLNLFSPSLVLPYLVNENDYGYPFSHYGIENLVWFNIPLGVPGISLILFVLFNFALWTYWMWQAIKRRFHNPNGTILSKGQSYWLTACFTVTSLGFAMSSLMKDYSHWLNFTSLLSLNLLVFVSLIAALSPQRQTLQDWARYRRERKSALIHDLLWGEKSPGLLAIALNLAIASIPLSVGIFYSNAGLTSLVGLIFTLNLVLVYAAIAQLMLLMKTPKRAIWTAGTLVVISLLPPLILTWLSISPGNDGGGLWLFTLYPWEALSYASEMLMLQVLLIEWIAVGGLCIVLTRQLRKVGESATKALLAGRSSVND